MYKIVNRLRLFFCFFSGEDDFLISGNNAKLQISFASIGFFVLLIFIGCWISASLFLSHLFDGNKWISISIGIIWALLVTNLYLLMLYTISPALLPYKDKKASKVLHTTPKDSISESPYTFSLFFRIGLIILLALIIVQPFNIFFLSTAEEESKRYAETLRNLFTTHPLAWVSTLGGCLIFLLPIYWKYVIRNNSGFYERKKEIEYRFVLDQYTEFKEQYSKIFAQHLIRCNNDSWKRIENQLYKLKNNKPESFKLYYDQFVKEFVVEKISKYEYWADPPFRTVQRKNLRVLSCEKEFINDIYPPEN